MLVWITQLGLSVAVPPVGFILLAHWLQNRFGWGPWVLWIAIALGVFCAVDGLIRNLAILNKAGKQRKKDPPPVSFNDHD